tara:strand:- start:1559 stop:2089 length:531 start_codon:yes stop_codon:yes gene_type:complete
MEDAQTPLLRWVKSNASTANLLSIVLLLFAAWAAVEIVSNVNGSDIPPTTGVLSNEDEPDGQRINNGVIIGLGAVAGTTGLILQLIITKDSPEENVVSEPVEDEDIDGVVEDSMDESQDGASEEDVSGEEIHEEEVPEDEESLEEEESTPEEQGEEESEDEAPAEENKTPIKKRKF